MGDRMRGQNMNASLAVKVPAFKKKRKVDVEGFEPSTSRMQSVRATTVPNAHKRNVISNLIP